MCSKYSHTVSAMEECLGNIPAHVECYGGMCRKYSRTVSAMEECEIFLHMLSAMEECVGNILAQ